MQFDDVPAGWQEVSYETDDGYHGLWACEDEQIAVDVTSNVEGDQLGYTAVAYQTVSSGDMETEIQTHALTETSREEIEQGVAEFMREVNDGHHRLHVMGHELWREFVQFYCVRDGDVPDGIDPDELIDALDNESFDNQFDELPDDDEFGDTVLTIDVFPRHKSEVDGYTEP